MHWRYALLIVLTSIGRAAAGEPEVLVDGVHLQLIAEQPRVVTPIGLAFDLEGRLLVVESHTHFPNQDYPGPKSDRILLLSDSNGDGALDATSVFHEGGRHTMCVAAHANAWIYVTTRSRLLRMRDSDQDGVADQQELLAELKTNGDYPHNGLSGLAFDSHGNVFFGLGENLGEPYQLHGKDGVVLRGGGEGGNIYQIGADGAGLIRIATGFWNPFGLCVDPQDRLFAVGNDPDSRPPCRLLHIVGGGDYGYQFRYGRSGLHPLQAWNGELPGTLPYVAGTGEAPSDIELFRGALWTTSWGHNRIERFRLTPSGASWHGQLQTIVRGDEHFRPVAFALAPDGALYFSDWVDRSYNVHRQGRIWRLTFDNDSVLRAEHPPLTESEKAARELERRPTLAALDDADVFLRQAGIWGWIQQPTPPDVSWDALTPHQKVAWLQIQRWREEPMDDLLRQAAKDPAVEVRLLAVRIISDRQDESWRSVLEAMTPDSVEDARLLAAVLAALDYLDAGRLTASRTAANRND